MDGDGFVVHVALSPGSPSLAGVSPAGVSLGFTVSEFRPLGFGILAFFM